MKDDVTKARDKFMEDVQELGFPVNIQGGEALRQRQQDEAGWPAKQKEQDAPMKEDETE